MPNKNIRSVTDSFRQAIFTLFALALCLAFAACGGSSSTPGGSDTPGSITTTSLPDGKVNSPYSATLTVTGGTPPYTWSGPQGGWPSLLALKLNASTGAITGTPTIPGVFGSLVFTVTDAKGNSANSSVLSINIDALPLIITTTSLPNGVVGQPYAAAVTRTGGNPPFTWAIKSGSLPPGLSLQPGGGITGTPTGPGNNPIVFEVTDSDGTKATSSNLSINLTLTVATTSLPGANQNSPYSTTLQATGGTPPYTWSGPIGGWPGLLPLTLNSSTGVISGTPNIPGPFGALVFTVTDSAGATANSQNLLIFVHALPLVITTTSLPEAFIANPYGGFGSAVQLSYTGGDPPVNFSIKSGSLPGGLSIPGPCNCSIAGTPDPSDPLTTYNFVLQAQDSDGTIATQPLSILLGQRVTITTTSLPNGTIGAPYSTTLQANYGTPPYTFAFQFPPPEINTLPPNVYLMPSGSISGTPLADGQGPVLYFQVTDNLGNIGYGAMDQIFLYPQLLITTTSLPNGAPGTAYSATLKGQGGNPPYTWSAPPGSLPPGLNLNASSGAITGTPTTNGTYPVTFTLTDSNNVTASAPLSITIATPPPVTVLNTSLPGTNGGNYTATLEAANGTPPYTWTLSSGTLPTGLHLSSAGVITGSTSVNGNYSLKFQAKDSNGNTGTSSALTLQVNNNAACPTGAEGKLTPQQPYAFLLKGFDSQGQVVIAGSFTTNGTGGITAGQEDVNRTSGYFHASSFTSASYTLGQDTAGANPRGCITLTTSTNTISFRFVISGNDGHYETGRIIEFDDSTGMGTRASGIMRRQDTSTFTQGPNGTYAFQFTGTDVHAKRFAAAGSLTASSQAILDVTADTNLGGTVNSDTTGGSGEYLLPDPVSGHGTGSLIIGANSVFDLPFSYYQVNAGEIIFVSNISINSSPIFGGEALASNGPFTTGQLTDYFMYHMDGTSSAGSAATLGALNFDGTGTFSGTYSQDVAGASVSNVQTNGLYQLDPVNGSTSGRVIFTGNFGSGSAPVGYLIAPTAATTTPSVYLVGTDADATTGLMESQSTTGTVDYSNFTGPFALGTDENPDNATSNEIGDIVVTPTVPPDYAFTGFADFNYTQPGGIAELGANLTIGDIAHLQTNGTGDFGVSTVAISNGTVSYYIDEDPAITHPVVVAVQP